MFRSLVLQELAKEQYQILNSGLFSSLFQKNNPKDVKKQKPVHSAPIPFATIDKNNGKITCILEILDEYRSDRVKFITKIDYREAEGSSTLEILPEPVKVKQNILHFLLIFKWFKISSAPEPKTTSRNSFNRRQGERISISRQNNDIDLFDLVYILSQSIFVESWDQESFVNLIQRKSDNCWKNTNEVCIIMMRNSAKKKDSHDSAGRSTEASSLPYSYKLSSTALDEIFQNEERNSGSKIEDSSNNMKKKKPNINLYHKQMKRIFTRIVQIDNDELNETEKLIDYLQESESNEGIPICLQSIQRLIDERGRLRNNPQQFYNINMDLIFRKASEACLRNYQEIAEMEMKTTHIRGLQAIFQLLKEITMDSANEFADSTKMYLREDRYMLQYQRFLELLKTEEKELMKAFAQVKSELAHRKIETSEKKTKKSNDYLFDKLYGEQSVDSLQIGYNLYKRIMEEKIPGMFDEFKNTTKTKKSAKISRVENNRDLSVNLETRIEIFKEKKKCLEFGISLSQKESDILLELLRGLQNSKNKASLNSLSQG